MVVDAAQIPLLAARLRSALDLSPGEGSGLEEFLKHLASDEAWQPATLGSRRQVAYALATTHHETDFTFLPIIERGTRAYFNRYDTGTSIGKVLGNTVAGDGYRFRGRGYVQLTGRANYQFWSDRLKLNLIDDPDKALDPAISYRILAEGMRIGAFTGRKIGEYLSDEKADYIRARKVINRLDRAARIATYATNAYRALIQEVD